MTIRLTPVLAVSPVLSPASETLIDGGVRLWPATLYRTLDDMAAEGLIVELRGDERPEGESARRRSYRVTSRGRAELSAAAERMAGLARVARRRLGDAPT